MDWNEAKNGLGRFTFEIRVRGIRVLSQLERRLSCHVPGFKSAHPAVPVTNTQFCIMHIMLNHVLCKGARVSVQSHIPPVKFPQTPLRLLEAKSDKHVLERQRCALH